MMVKNEKKTIHKIEINPSKKIDKVKKKLSPLQKVQTDIVGITNLGEPVAIDLKNNKSLDEVRIRSTKDLGSSIKTFRTSQKMTQADILGLANTGNRFIVELENGKNTVQFNKVLDVLDTLGLEMVIKKKSNL